MKNLKQVIFMAKDQALKLRPKESCVLISIQDPGAFDLQFNSAFQADQILRLKFNVGNYLSDGRVFSEEDANSVVNFFKKHQELPELTVYVHCTYAEQRSPSIARAISDCFEVPLFAFNQKVNSEDVPVYCGRAYSLLMSQLMDHFD